MKWSIPLIYDSLTCRSLLSLLKLCNENYNKIELGKYKSKKTHFHLHRLADTNISFFQLQILYLGTQSAA